MWNDSMRRKHLSKVIQTKVLPYAVASITMLTAVCASAGPAFAANAAPAARTASTSAVMLAEDEKDLELIDKEDLEASIPKATCTEAAAISAEDGYTAVQGGCTDGKNAYLIMEKQASEDGKQSFIIQKIDVQTWKPVAKSEALELGHANDITYDTKQGHLAVVHNDGATHISFIDPETLEVKETRDFTRETYGIAYDASRDQYTMTLGGEYEYATAVGDFKSVGYATGDKNENEKQGIECDGEYIYFATSAKNTITCYDTSGNLKGVFLVEGVDGTVEGVFTDGETWYVTANTDAGAKVYKASFDMSLLEKTPDIADTETPDADTETPDTSTETPDTDAAETSADTDTAEETPYFEDVPVNHWAYKYVKQAKDDGVINGVATGEEGKYAFMPSREVTCSELTAIVVRGYFNDDVDARAEGETWDAPYIRAAEKNGLLEGLEDLDMHGPMTRYEMAVFLSNAVKAVALDPQMSFSGVTLDSFSDAEDIPDEYKDAVSYCVTIGILKGVGDSFAGDRSVTRAETAAIYVRLASFTANQEPVAEVDDAEKVVISGETDEEDASDTSESSETEDADAETSEDTGERSDVETDTDADEKSDAESEDKDAEDTADKEDAGEADADTSESDTDESDSAESDGTTASEDTGSNDAE